MSRRPFLTARILLVFYLIAGLLLPLGGLVSASAPVLPEINFSSPAFEAAPQAEASSTKETPPTASVRQNEDYLYLNFPDEGPEAAILADLLSKMAINALFDPFVRPARMSEVVDTLTYSVYTTMMILGSFVFGVGLIILSWKVYHSVRDAAKSEPVTLSFLCTIPGLRYLNNHVRYHLFDMPLQPRRRFASFVGASGSGGVDLLDMDNEDLAVAQARGRGAEPGSPHPIVKMTRRKSMLRTVTTTQTVNAGKKQQIPDLRKRHSVANMYTPPPSAPVSHVPSASPSPVPEASNELEICNSERTAVPEIIIEPKTGLMNEKEPIAAPVPMSACVVPQFNSIVEGGGESEDLDARRRRSMDDTTSQEESSVTPTEESLRPWTPISTLSTEDTDDQHTSLHPPYFNPEELSRRRADWVQTMQLFNRDYSPLPPEATQPLESKLSRRLYQTNVPPSGGYSGLEHSKLSRYFSNTSPTTVSSLPTDIPNSSCLTPAMSNPELDSITQQLHDGDLTPPPGFNRRHSSHNASAPRQLGLKQLHRQVEVRMVEEEEEDTVSSPPGYHAAFMNAAERGRRTLFVPSNQSRLVNEVAQSSDQWRWFMGTDNDPVWDPPIRPHSSTDLNRAHLAPVGSGSRSAGRVTPEVLPPKRKNHSNISLGIFDEMFPQ